MGGLALVDVSAKQAIDDASTTLCNPLSLATLYTISKVTESRDLRQSRERLRTIRSDSAEALARMIATTVPAHPAPHVDAHDAVVRR